MKLYKIVTMGLGDFYVIAEHPTEAETLLASCLSKADYGFYEHRATRSIHVMTSLIDASFNGKPFISETNRLVMEEK